MALLTSIEELKQRGLALEAALLSPTLTVKYADKTMTYRSASDIRMALADVYAKLREAGELDPGSARQIRPINGSGW